MKKFFSLLLIVVTIFQTSSIVNAASYPLMYPEEVNMTIKKGDVAELKFKIWHEYNNEKYHVNIYKGSLVDIKNGTAQLVGSAEDTIYAGGTNGYTNLSITWDTSDVECGLYTVEHWMSFYSLFEWHDEPTKDTLMFINVVDQSQYDEKLQEIKVKLNGKNIAFDQPPIIENGRTLVPLRAIFEALGASVDWDNDTQTVTSAKDDTNIKLTINDKTMYVNGVSKTLDVPAKLLNGRTLVPVRAVSEAFDCKVDWENASNTVIITY